MALDFDWFLTSHVAARKSFFGGKTAPTHNTCLCCVCVVSVSDPTVVPAAPPVDNLASPTHIELDVMIIIMIMITV